MVDVDAIRDALDSAIPCAIATVAADGTPNVTLVSHAEYVDAQHVALTFQFFNKTRENILAWPQAMLYVTHAATGASYRLQLDYLRTELEGPLFERLRARLAGIASHTGMSGVFKLRGADLYRVRAIEAVDGIVTTPAPAQRNLLAAVRRSSEALAAADSFENLLDTLMATLASAFCIDHAMLLMLDAAGDRLYTVASHGYPQSGVGSEIALGDGVIGVAAAHRVPIRLSYASTEYAYGRAQRQHAAQRGLNELLQKEIPYPGLGDAQSQLAVPIVTGARLLGALFVESLQQRRFGYDEEDALAALAAQLSTALERWQEDEATETAAAGGEAAAPPAAGTAVMIRRYVEDDSIFVDEQYLIKGVAGAILWKLLRDYDAAGRRDFSNRELRLDASLRLPDISDNLEARLALLNRRLGERCDFLRLDKTGRGRFQLQVQRSIRLSEVGA